VPQIATVDHAMILRAEGGRGQKGGKLTTAADSVRRDNAPDLQARLEREVAAHDATRHELADARRELDSTRRDLERRVEQRTYELSLLKARFETALHGAKVYVFSQDRELRYTWVYSPRGEEAAAEMVGRTDDEINPSPEHEAVVALKRRVLETGVSQDCEVSYIMPERRALFALHIDPIVGPGRKIVGIMCAAIDISRIRSLESEQRRLTEELGTAVQRYETALRGSNVSVFTQDIDLRYTSLSKPLFGRDSADILGRTDIEILPPESAASISALKRDVLAKGHPKDAEVRVDGGAGVHWYDLHIEPLRDVTGGIVGLTCAAVDITERKEGEAHLRLLMRELTHRSKNLLAVIQAMARQTARQGGTIANFLERFSARLQALSRSHDLLVQESWHGASLQDLVRSQLGHYLDRDRPQVSIVGPDIHLRPEAAQSLGLALHELATNAAKYGALSRPRGRVAVEWHLSPPERGGGLEIIWKESKGPKVGEPRRRGFGSMVIEHNLARALDAEVNLDFPLEGLRCRVAVPPSQFSAGR
jgi:PAS domain S-box-containing protein